MNKHTIEFEETEGRGWRVSIDGEPLEGALRASVWVRAESENIAAFVLEVLYDRRDNPTFVPTNIVNLG